jgi:hypothetical protein
MENTVEKQKDADEGHMYQSKWTEGYFFCINPYGPTVESHSTYSVVLGRVSTLNRHITFQCFTFVFAEFMLPSGCFWTLKITVSWKLIWTRLLELTKIIWTEKCEWRKSLQRL